MKTAYHLKTVPDGIEPMTPQNQGDENILKWSGEIAIPEIGDKITVRMNNLGTGTVKEYFHEAGYLGVAVALDSPPPWYVIQNGGKALAYVFGREITK